jgi:hypothetical protein
VFQPSPLFGASRDLVGHFGNLCDLGIKPTANEFRKRVTRVFFFFGGGVFVEDSPQCRPGWHPLTPRVTGFQEHFRARQHTGLSSRCATRRRRTTIRRASSPGVAHGDNAVTDADLGSPWSPAQTSGAASSTIKGWGLSAFVPAPVCCFNGSPIQDHLRQARLWREGCDAASMASRRGIC